MLEALTRSAMVELSQKLGFTTELTHPWRFVTHRETKSGESWITVKQVCRRARRNF